MNDAPKNGRAAETDPLLGTEFEQLPEVFAMRNDDNSIVQEREPCYICQADCFLGSGHLVTLFPESSIVVTRAVPNNQMQPLNRAAALNYVGWISRLPEYRTPIDAGDMAEAAHMLAKDPDILKLNKIEWQQAVTKLAVSLKLKREGQDAKDLPPIGHNFAHAPRGNAPPILGAKMSDMAQRLPGETRLAAAIPGGPTPLNVRRGTAAPMNVPGR